MKLLLLTLSLLPVALCALQNRVTAPPAKYSGFFQHQGWKNVRRSDLGITTSTVNGEDHVASLACFQGGLRLKDQYSVCAGSNYLHAVCDVESLTAQRTSTPVYIQVDCAECRNNFDTSRSGYQFATCKHYNPL